MHQIEGDAPRFPSLSLKAQRSLGGYCNKKLVTVTVSKTTCRAPGPIMVFPGCLTCGNYVCRAPSGSICQAYRALPQTPGGKKNRRVPSRCRRRHFAGDGIDLLRTGGFHFLVGLRDGVARWFCRGAAAAYEPSYDEPENRISKKVVGAVKSNHLYSYPCHEITHSGRCWDAKV